ncbi:hypothetical protein HWV62_33101 [Athelia sp. TMB]|nr:hypothetical protein HWV62_33101 [Athelia sp. TMB]
MLFTTIARDLARSHSGVAEDIIALLEKEPSLASSSLSRQFEAFVLNPFCRRSQDHPILIVIDALDESIHDDMDTELLTILRDGVAKLPHYFRILITSRPMKSFQQFFSESSHITTYSIDIHSIENQQDISKYVDAQMRDRVLLHAMGPGWQDDVTMLEDLKKLAEGPFIWIVTVCSYLRAVYKPRAKLEALLSKSAPEGLPVEKKMDDLYITILAACGEWEDTDFVQDYHLIMGAIMAAKRPLSLAALRELHSSSQKLSPEDILQRFGSVLVGLDDPHAPIRMLHLSFREFITGRAANEESTRKFFISEKVHSSRLAHLCIMVMNSELAIGNLSGTGYLKKQWILEYTPGIPIVSGASEQLMYGCEHWIEHVLDVENTETILPSLLRFVSVHLTVWMEIVASRGVFRGSLAIRRWLQEHSPEWQHVYDDQIAGSALFALSDRLSYAVRFEEALLAIQEAVYLYRALSEKDPSSFISCLSACLASLSNCLSNVGRPGEALEVIQEVVLLRKSLAREQPSDFKLHFHLAQSLNTLSIRLSELGRRKEALEAIQQAVDLYRDLAITQTHPAILVVDSTESLNDHLAKYLKNKSAHNSPLGRQQNGALDAIEMAASLDKQLMSVLDQGDTLDSLLAQALPGIGRGLDLGQYVETKLLSPLFNAELAASLHSLSSHLAELGRWREALNIIQEAVALRRSLAGMVPAAFNADLAESLQYLSYRLSDFNEFSKALKACQEVVDLRRPLMIERPAAFADSLKALDAIQEVVGLCRGLAATHPAAFRDRLAMSLKLLFICLSHFGRRRAVEALSVMREVTHLYQSLATERPSVFSADLAASLCDLSKALSRLDMWQEAVTTIREGSDIYRALAAQKPTDFTTDFTISRQQLSECLSGLRQRQEALSAAQDIADLRRALAAEHGAERTIQLTISLIQLSVCFSNLGQQEEALLTIQEVVDLRRSLARDQSEATDAQDNLARSLGNLGKSLSGLNKGEEALAAIHEAVVLRRTLAFEHPAYKPQLIRSLRQLAYCLKSNGREEEAGCTLQEVAMLA